MSNVIHISQDDWNSMRHIRDCMRYYRDNYSPKYDKVLGKVNVMYKEALKKIA